MGDVHYMISEAAKKVSVEPHVLRYWEEELALPIGRTEMGHRYYTEENIQLFNCIKQLKEQGILLRELKTLIPDMLKIKQELQLTKEAQQKMLSPREPEPAAPAPAHSEKEPEPAVHTDTLSESALREILTGALSENNKVLEQNVSRIISANVIQEMDILLRAKEQQEEERFRRLDSLIRQQQTLRKETAQPHRLRQLAGFFSAN